MRGQRKSKPVIHYDEREWRYIAEGLDIHLISGKKDSNNSLWLRYIKAILDNPNQFLTFKPKDIKYLIVEDSAFDDIVLTIKNEFSDIKTGNELISKIITVKEIEEDF